MKRRQILLASVVAVSALGMGAGSVFAQEKWKPAKTISVVVPWPAGGASDTVARMISGVMEQAVGQRMVVVNTPGGAGAIGTKEVWDKPHDGYTLTANSTVSVGSYAVLGKMDQTHRDWIYYLPIFTPNVICVKADSPIKSIDDLVAAMKAKPNAVVLASAGIGSSGYFAAELFKAATGVTYRHVPYAGGVPAVMSVASGEAEVVMQLSVEVAELLRSGKLRALAVSSKEPLNVQRLRRNPADPEIHPVLPRLRFLFRRHRPGRPAEERRRHLRRGLREGRLVPGREGLCEDQGRHADRPLRQGGDGAGRAPGAQGSLDSVRLGHGRQVAERPEDSAVNPACTISA
ncbi:Bug family tripartite tricarboxylate transporter substrate binding protein [Propionivibrio sp.]|uniref:Bug family tripartite tricarboxylate transporter substrate binding protein n=1 Tax=Propionivibrio sp. TaxID=2212460 RepID=UPI0039E37F2E